jgi:hypothetical protein
MFLRPNAAAHAKPEQLAPTMSTFVSSIGMPDNVQNKQEFNKKGIWMSPFIKTGGLAYSRLAIDLV